ncbi:MAG: histidine--tRNA ligase [Methanosphaera sp.]|nr:histidine--tRNA ligase [Methanosphaera sp.]
MEFSKPRGTRDFLFNDMDERKYVENTIRRIVENYGFKEIKTPIFEDLELFTTRSGEGIKEELYHFKDKGNRDLALRPEMTASVARLYNNNLQREAKPLKMYYFGSCFRYERPQAGRFRQFWQFGLEVIGGEPVYNEAEIIVMANEVLSTLKIRNYEIAIGHLGIIKGVLNKLEIPSQTQTQIIASIDKEDYELLDQLLDNEGVSSDEKDVINSIINVYGDHSQLETLRDKLTGYSESLEALDELNNILSVIETFGYENYNVKLSIARGLDYYTGLVFEIYVSDLGAQKQITGGGSYNLMGLFDSEEVESTGFAFGFDRIMEAFHIQNLEVEKDDTPRVLVVPVKKDFKSDAIKIAQLLRQDNIVTDIDLKAKKLKKNLSYADSHNFNKVIMIGSQEVEDNTVTIKDLDSRQQVTVSVDEMITTIRGKQ